MLRVYLFSLAAWAAVLVAGVALRRRKAGKYLLRAAYVVFLLFCVEFACVLGFYLKNRRRWTFDERKVHLRQLFEPHPYMVGVPRKGARVTFRGRTYTHNAQGFRGRDFAPKSGAVRVIAMGGSTTYGASVEDGETWPAQLGSQLGPSYEVLNFGVIGHGTAEHINQAALVVPEYKPDVLLIHAGLNDLRNLRVRNLAADYSDYHAPSLYGGMGFCSEGGAQNLASVRVATGLLKRAGLYPRCPFDDLKIEVDDSVEARERAKSLYRRNLRTLVAVAKSQGLRPVLVPQVLIKEWTAGDDLRWWIPLVAGEELPTFMGEYNEVMRGVAEDEGLRYAHEVLEHAWAKEDFVDPSHLSPEGNRKFASLLHSAVREAAPQAP